MYVVNVKGNTTIQRRAADTEGHSDSDKGRGC
jgi:hypothetical protein